MKQQDTSTVAERIVNLHTVRDHGWPQSGSSIFFAITTCILIFLLSFSPIIFSSQPISPLPLSAPVASISAKIALQPGDPHFLWINASNYFTIAYLLQGTIHTVDYTGTPITIVFDHRSMMNISGESSQSNSHEKWCFEPDCSNVSIQFADKNFSLITYYYTDLQEVLVSKKTLGGGLANASTYYSVPGAFPNPGPPDNVTESFLPVKINLTSVPNGIWNPRSFTTTVYPAVEYFGSNERWALVNNTGSSIPLRIPNSVFVYEHQYSVVIEANNLSCISPYSPGWGNVNQTIQLLVVVFPGCHFVSWAGRGNGSYTGTDFRPYVIVKGPITEIAILSSVSSSASLSITTTSASSSSLYSASSTLTAEQSTLSTSTNQSTHSASESTANTSPTLSNVTTSIVLAIVTAIVAIIVGLMIFTRRPKTR